MDYKKFQAVAAFVMGFISMMSRVILTAEPRIVEGPRNTTALQGHRVWLHCVVSTVSAATTASLPLTSPLPILTSTISPAAVTNSVTYVTTTPAKLNNTVRTPVLSSTTPINSSISAHPIDASRHAPTFDPPEREETRVTWQRDGRSLHTTIEGSAWTVLANGSLRLNSVDHVDAGPYRCIARNRNGVAFSQPAYLAVHMPAKISGGRRWFNVTYGQKLLLECQARGEPAPQIIWLYHGEPA